MTIYSPPQLLNSTCNVGDERLSCKLTPPNVSPPRSQMQPQAGTRVYFHDASGRIFHGTVQVTNQLGDVSPG